MQHSRLLLLIIEILLLDMTFVEAGLKVSKNKNTVKKMRLYTLIITVEGFELPVTSMDPRTLKQPKFYMNLPITQSLPQLKLSSPPSDHSEVLMNDDDSATSGLPETSTFQTPTTILELTSELAFPDSADDQPNEPSSSSESTTGPGFSTTGVAMSISSPKQSCWQAKYSKVIFGISILSVVVSLAVALKPSKLTTKTSTSGWGHFDPGQVIPNSDPLTWITIIGVVCLFVVVYFKCWGNTKVKKKKKKDVQRRNRNQKKTTLASALPSTVRTAYSQEPSSSFVTTSRISTAKLSSTTTRLIGSINRTTSAQQQQQWRCSKVQNTRR